MRRLLILTRILYLLLIGMLFYLLLISRFGEVQTVWEHMHPTFLPMYFVTTTLLAGIVFTQERTEFKVFFIIVHSILSTSFFVILFPAGYIGFQQSTLGRTRRIFDNISPHGYGGTVDNPLMRMYNWFGGANFQSAYSVTFTRMLSVELFWVHLFLIPILWGIFIPAITFIITRTLGGDKKTSALASLLSSASILLLTFGAISVPNSLGLIFFLGSLLFFLKYLTSPQPKYLWLMLILTFASFLSHFLTGVITLSLFLLALSVRRYMAEREKSPSSTRLFLASAFILATSILPLALTYHNFFSPTFIRFSLDRAAEYTILELFGELLIGPHLHYPADLTIMFTAIPIIALIWLIYKFYKTRNQKINRDRIFMIFSFLGLLVLMIDYRILRTFMVNIPFKEERLWAFRDLLSIPFAALAMKELPALLRRITHAPAAIYVQKHRHALSLLSTLLISVLIAGWITLSINYAYPHTSQLQTTSYELEAIRYIDDTTDKHYIVICSQWTAYAGAMSVGIQNGRAYYFADYDPQGVMLFTEMKNNPSVDVMIEAMNYTDAEIAYFIVVKARLGEGDYNRVVQEAQSNGLETYPGGVFYFEGVEKLRVFYYPTD